MSNTPRLLKFRHALPLVLVGALTIALLVVVAWQIKARVETRDVIIAAGTPNSESFVLMQALKVVAERYYPRYKILVHETGGTAESLDALHRGGAQLAIAQADGLNGHDARTVAVLYRDVVQILAHKESGIQQFADLKGKRLAVPRNGGQFVAFLNIAGHYGFGETDFKLVGTNDESADLAYVKGDADAIFRIRPLPNVSTSRLAAVGATVVVPIDQASAIRLDVPAYSPVTIPKGACSGHPPVPEADTLTVATPRLLVARDDDDQLVTDMAQVLMERRPELVAAIGEYQVAVRPLVASIQPPDPRPGLAFAIHPAARADHDGIDVPVVGRFADWIAALVALGAVIGLCGWAIRAHRRSVGAATAGALETRAAALIAEAQTAPTARELRLVRAELIGLVPGAVDDLLARRLPEGSLRTVQSLVDLGLGIARQRLTGGGPADATLLTEGGVSPASSRLEPARGGRT